MCFTLSTKAPFAVLLNKKLKSGYIVIVCGAIIGLSAITASFVTTPIQLAMLYALPAGIQFY